jgi:hypothetical protein
METVPEPDSALIMLAGLAVIGVPWLLQKKRRRS